MTPKFTELNLSDDLLRAIDKLGFEQASPIQAAAIPPLMAGKDIVVQPIQEIAYVGGGGVLEVRAEVEAVLREGESLTQFIEEAVVSAAAWRRVQAEFVNRGEAAIERWKREGGGRAVDEVMAGLQGRLDDAKRRAAKRAGK